MPRRIRLVLLLVVAIAPWMGPIGCGGVSNPTDEAVVIVQEPAPPEGDASPEAAAPAP